MSSTAGDEAGSDLADPAGNLTEADRALVLAMRAWPEDGRRPAGERGGAVLEHDFLFRFGNWLEPARVKRLASAWDRASRGAGFREPAAALERLERMHRASARVELSEVHPSWLIRALREESPAVQRIVVASFPERVRHSLQGELLLDSDDIQSERAASPECREWVLGLWTERLVGGERERPDDPPAVIAMSGLSPRAGYGLCRAAGVGKMMLAGQTPGWGRPSQERRARWEWLHGRLAATDGEFQAQVRRDVQAVAAAKVPRRHHAARLGLVTFARLLADCEPFRLRWALQHWPYPIAKLIRSLLPAGLKHAPALLRGESLVLKTAWDRLSLEGRLAMDWPDSQHEKTGAS
jgi:hypothetical protein